ncbi:MAG: acyltransferase family protein [Eubacteriales bacterium]|nr:acyltransferase family protein [Eubacteriales bacterium]
MIPNAMLLFMSFGYKGSLSNISWYISAMLISMLLLYPLARGFRRNSNLIGAVNIALFGTSYLYINFENYKVMRESCGIMTGGMLRAIIGLCVGCMVYEFSNYLKAKEITRAQEMFLSLADVVLIGCILFVMSRGDLRSGFVIPILMFFLVSIVTSGQNYFSKYFDNKGAKLLGQLSLYIYLLHVVARKIIYFYRPKIRMGRAYIAIGLLTAVMVVLVMGADHLRKKRAAKA